MTRSHTNDPSCDFSSLVESGQIVFFVGSGISVSYPACLPSAAELVGSHLSWYLAEASAADRKELLEKIWPEVFYQELMAFIGDAALHTFKVLAYPGAKPTLAHYLVVNASAAAGVPIVTTNFDRLLEDAAKTLNQNAQAVGPSEPYWPEGAKLPIWKVHGSVEAANQDPPDSILATVSQITKPNMLLLRELRALLTKRHVCFLGYSGRDLDLFPLIRNFPDIKPPFWIDPYPSAQLKDRAKAIGATLITSTLEEVCAKHLPGSLDSLESAGLSLANFQPADNHDNELRSEITNELLLIGKQQRNNHGLTPEQQRLLLGICLYRIGRYPAALTQLEKHEANLRSRLDRTDQALLLATMARLYDITSDYRRSEKYARLILNATKGRWGIGRNPELIALRIQGLHALSMAKKMQLGPSVLSLVKCRIKLL